MKKVSSLLLLLFSLISFLDSAQAQTTTTVDEKVILGSFNGYGCIFHDYDNEDNLWFSLRTDTSLNLYHVDNSLNVTQTIVNKFAHPFCFKLNDKLYGTAGCVRMIQDLGYLISDSIYFYTNDNNGNNINCRIIFSYNEDTTKYYNINSCFVTKDKNIGILLNIIDKNSRAINPKLIIIDTLGERIVSKDFRTINSNIYSNIKIYETDSIFVINKTNCNIINLISNSAYNINKNTLDIIDSVSYDSVFYIDNLKKINDTTIITISQNGKRLFSDPPRYFINIVNDKKREITSQIKIEHGGEDIVEGYLPDYQECVDFINQDSIYFCTFVSHNTGIYDNNYSGFIQIVNFGIDGDLNFDYRFRYDTVLPKQTNGVKATADGGLLIAVQITTNDCWIMKFMPNGVVSLANVETGEKESIKVYPNPARDYVNVDIECTNFKASDIELLDMQGRIVKKAKLKAKQGNRIDVSSLSAGAYSYNVSLNGKTISGKVIVGK